MSADEKKQTTFVAIGALRVIMAYVVITDAMLKFVSFLNIE